MQPEPQPTHATRPIATALLNAIPNLFWSLLCITPIYIFCARSVDRKTLVAFAIVSLVPYCFPRSLLHSLALSKSLRTYQKLGVHKLQRFTQDGALTRRHAPRRLAWDATAAVKLQRAADGRERFHSALLIFYLLAAAFAAATARPAWAVLITLLNGIYNLYPIWLQQYIRLRVDRLAARNRRNTVLTADSR